MATDRRVPDQDASAVAIVEPARVDGAGRSALRYAAGAAERAINAADTITPIWVNRAIMTGPLGDRRCASCALNGGIAYLI